MTASPPVAPLRYSDLSPADVAVLRIESALESTYPHIAKQQGERRASVILAGWAAWRSKSSAKPVLAQGPGIPTSLDSRASRELAHAAGFALDRG